MGAGASNAYGGYGVCIRGQRERRAETNHWDPEAGRRMFKESGTERGVAGTTAERHGLNAPANPKAGRMKGGPSKQSQEWPGREKDLKPKADHGEKSYTGADKLKGKRAIITGADSGIGRAVAIAFAREGADVAIAYYNERDDAAETERWVRDAGRKSLTIEGDLRDPEHCKEIVEEAVDSFGGVDILVNNAAFQMEQKDFLKITPEQLDQTFRTNICAYIWMAQAALPEMDEGSVILNTGSVTALKGHPTLVDYAATKGAIHNFTQSLAQVVADKGIRVNCIAPGPVWTPLIPATKSTKGHGAETFWERPAQPAEMAPTYVFLASADGRYYSGSVFSPTGSKDAAR
jgi:NAD(P)-dependent dehydrogenase (short-subunit alcohol dehydrogenase family)